MKERITKADSIFKLQAESKQWGTTTRNCAVQVIVKIAGGGNTLQVNTIRDLDKLQWKAAVKAKNQNAENNNMTINSRHKAKI